MEGGFWFDQRLKAVWLNKIVGMLDVYEWMCLRLSCKFFSTLLKKPTTALSIAPATSKEYFLLVAAGATPTDDHQRLDFETLNDDIGYYESSVVQDEFIVRVMRLNSIAWFDRMRQFVTRDSLPSFMLEYVARKFDADAFYDKIVGFHSIYSNVGLFWELVYKTKGTRILRQWLNNTIFQQPSDIPAHGHAEGSFTACAWTLKEENNFREKLILMQSYFYDSYEARWCEHMMNNGYYMHTIVAARHFNVSLCPGLCIKAARVKKSKEYFVKLHEELCTKGCLNKKKKKPATRKRKKDNAWGRGN